MKVSRRVILRGIGGATLALPFLEGLADRQASAQTGPEPFVIFFRQGNGVGTAQTYSLNGGSSITEPERFWPTEFGELTPERLSGRALDELVDYREKLLVVKNVNMHNYDYADGHARGALQCLTARGPVVPGMGGDSEADGESIDHRIGRELNPNGNDSLFLYAGQNGWLGGPCISYRGSNNRRSALRNPFSAYETMVGQAGGLTPEAIAQLVERNRSVNDLVREQLVALRSNPKLSTADRQRLDLHLSSIRDLESSLTCRLKTSEEMELSGLTSLENSTDGDEVLRNARAQMDIAALAVACGYTRSVAIQVGNGNDGSTRYRHSVTGELMENFHYISHRLLSHSGEGDVYEGADLLHHEVDRQFARTFKYLLDRLSAYEFGDETLLDRGIAVWFNDLGNGPAHSARHIPYVIAGSAGGFLKQGMYIQLDNGQNGTNLARVLNTLGSAVGLRKENGDLIDDFGDPELDRRPHPDLMA